ncbi:MAG TPA: DUF2723 domain-containing protein [Thermoanaerobaculia bacterium]
MNRVHYSVAAAVFIVALSVYLITLAPSVAFIDSGLLTVAAWSGGNAHPPGFPLYLILTKLATLLIPVGSVAWRVNVASAFFAAAACGMAALAAGEALLYRPARNRSKPAEPPAMLVLLTMVLAGALLLSGRTLWGYATLAEVYALNTFLIVTIFWLLLRWRRTERDREVYVAALVFGLALGVHHVTVGLMLPAIAVFVLRTRGLRLLRSRTFATATAVSVAGLIAVYSYLPFAAMRNPVLNWGDPSTVAKFIQHVTAAQFRSFVSTTASSSQLEVVASLAGREFGSFHLVLLLAAIGLIAIVRSDRSLFWLLVLAAVAACSWLFIYPIHNDRDAYLLPAFFAIALAAALGAAAISRERPALLTLFFALPLLSAVANSPYRDRSDWRVPQRYVENALRGIEQNALLITADEQLYGPVFYFQEVERLRQDVRSLHWHLLMRPWYVEQVERRHPELFTHVQEELSVLRPYLAMLRDDPSSYHDPAVRTALDSSFDALLLAVIGAHVERGVAVYLTQDIAYSRNPVDQNFVRRLASDYELLPRGIAVAVLPRGRVRDVTLTEIDLAGLADGTIRYEADDVVVTEVLPAYRAVLLLRARYLRLSGDLAGAAAEYRAALRLDPGSEEILRELRTLEGSVR